MIVLNMPMYNKEIEEAALEALRNEKYVLGESVYKFEEEFAKYIGVDYAVSCSSGTMAFWLILNSLKAKKVMVPANTFHTVASVVKMLGKELIFGDVNMEDGCMTDVIMKESGKYCLVPTHLYGNFCDTAYRSIEEYELSLTGSNSDMWRTKDVLLIEDCSQAAGLEFEGIKAGSWGKAGFFSLYTTKNLSCLGDGGIVTTDDVQLANEIDMIADCGRNHRGKHVRMGITSRLNTVNAAIARVQLKHLDEWNQRRMALRDRYTERLPSEVKVLSNGVAHQMVIRVEQRHMLHERDKLAKYLEQSGIETGVHYRVPLHMQEPFYRKDLVLPNAKVLCNEVLSLPISPSLMFNEVDFIAEKVGEFYEGGWRK